MTIYRRRRMMFDPKDPPPEPDEGQMGFPSDESDGQDTEVEEG
jgi:hypothetical protein